MKRDNWPVEEHGIRPAGKPDECFYCHEPKGGVHKPSCVIRKRTVVVELRMELVLSEPEHWAPEDIEFFFSESSSCQSNIVNRLEALRARLGCICGLVDVTYVREAKEEDEQLQKLFVADEPS